MKKLYNTIPILKLRRNKTVKKDCELPCCVDVLFTTPNSLEGLKYLQKGVRKVNTMSQKEVT